jgi:CheY-like chemotaxis protein
VRITSAEGRGTTVAIALPLDRDGPESRPAPEAARADVDGGPPRRVLLVEDDDQVRDTAREMLERLGHEVVSVGGADAALEASSVDAQGYDLIFSDVNLGEEGSDGVSLSRALAQRLPGVPVVLTSGLDRDLLAQRYGLSPSTPVLAKPYRLEVLAEVVRTNTAGANGPGEGQ